MNLGPPPTALAFEITTQTNNSVSRPTRPRNKRSTQADDSSSPSPLTSAPPPVLRWDPHPIEYFPDDPTDNAFAETDEHDRLELAQDWLRTQLRDGRRPSAELKRRARQAGISIRALWHAKRALDITAVKEGPHGQWHWAPPPDLGLVDLTELLPPFPAPPPPPPPPKPKTAEEFLRRYPPSPEMLAAVRAERERRRKAREAESTDRHGTNARAPAPQRERGTYPP